MKRSRSAFVALGLLVACPLVGLVAGCSSGDPQPKVAPSSPVSASVSASSSVAPSGPVEPVMPAAAKKHTAAGAEAFVRFWFQAFSYAMVTGDTSLVSTSSAPGCTSCATLVQRVDGIYRKGGRVKTGGWHLEIASKPRGGLKQSPQMLLRVRQDRRALLDEGGHVVDRSPMAKVPMRVALERTSGGWSLRTLEIIG